MDKSILRRLEALENSPGSRIPHFIVETVDGTTQTVHGFGLLAVSAIRRVQFDPTQLCAQVVIDLFMALRGDGVEVVADAQH